MSASPGGPALGDGQRTAWSKTDRLERNRQRADRFRQLAEEDAQPRGRGRLHELALQYLELADRVAGPKVEMPEVGAPERVKMSAAARIAEWRLDRHKSEGK